ncbi:antirestriction protein [Salinisphaera orenii]|uniref:antirestriction protein n=1 Tax=Salinisphaera orenii TaxID=856731 RepID=UPI000DBE14E8
MTNQSTEADQAFDGTSVPTTATVVDDDARLQFLPNFFGTDLMIVGEGLVYGWLARLSRDYNGGFWTYYELSNGGYYMAPALDRESLHIRCEGNYFEGYLSPDAAGIVATLHALNRLAWDTGRSRMVDLFDRLRDYAGDHAENATIFAAID